MNIYWYTVILIAASLSKRFELFFQKPSFQISRNCPPYLLKFFLKSYPKNQFLIYIHRKNKFLIKTAIIYIVWLQIEKKVFLNIMGPTITRYSINYWCNSIFWCYCINNRCNFWQSKILQTIFRFLPCQNS